MLVQINKPIGMCGAQFTESVPAAGKDAFEIDGQAKAVVSPPNSVYVYYLFIHYKDHYIECYISFILIVHLFKL